MARTPALAAAEPTAAAAPVGPRLNPGWVAGALIAIAIALAAGVFIGIASHGNDKTTRTARPAVAEDSVDVGFCRDMQDHHAQAVEMSVMVREATDDPQVRTLALDILLTQQQQAGQMFGWLAAWGHPQSGAGEVMAWMSSNSAETSDGDHAGHGTGESASGADSSSGSSSKAGMPGMATSAQLRQLDQADGRLAERIYLQLMLPHHRAGVTMAEYAVEHATEPQVRALAESIVNSQTAELTVLQSMLDARGGPLPGL